uniref:Uncharacterized protein n=1 Tax=Anguilla anguilla TaxID=7936 RepID=A0A0E9X9I6_ANGAN
MIEKQSFHVNLSRFSCHTITINYGIQYFVFFFLFLFLHSLNDFSRTVDRTRKKS